MSGGWYLAEPITVVRPATIRYTWGFTPTECDRPPAPPETKPPATPTESDPT